MQTTAFLGVAHIHTPGFISTINKRSDVACKLVYDHEADRAEARAAQLEAKVATIEEICADPEITSVVICSETARHLPLIEAAAQAGKHIFAEKPLATTGEDAVKMQKLIEKAGVTFQTGFFMRSAPQTQFLKREVAAGNLGDITRMRHTNCHSGALGGWFDKDWHWIADPKEAGGGGFADLGAHSLDIILYVLRPVCGKVTRTLGMIGTQTKRYGEIDEYGAGLLHFESGAIADVAASWVDAKLHAPIEIHGTKGQIIVTDGKVLYYSDVTGAKGEEVTDLPPAAPHAFELFWDKLEGKDLAVPLVGVDEAAEESAVMADLYKSANSK